jgi:hypothetical protein
MSDAASLYTQKLSIQLKSTLTLIRRNPLLEVSLKSFLAFDIFVVYCKSEDIKRECIAALVIVMTLSTYLDSSIKPPCLTTRLKPLKFDASRGQNEDFYESLFNCINSCITLSCISDGINSLLCGVFFEPTVPCNLVGAHMLGVMKAIGSLQNDPRILASLMAQKVRRSPHYGWQRSGMIKRDAFWNLPWEVFHRLAYQLPHEQGLSNHFFKQVISQSPIDKMLYHALANTAYRISWGLTSWLPSHLRRHLVRRLRRISASMSKCIYNIITDLFYIKQAGYWRMTKNYQIKKVQSLFLSLSFACRRLLVQNVTRDFCRSKSHSVKLKNVDWFPQVRLT